jgi:hypothetical protein
MKYFGIVLISCTLLLHAGIASAPAKASKVFLLEDAGNNQWCSNISEPTWKTKVQETGAMTVGAVIYSNDHLAEIDVTETDESGDWTVYDHYLFDDHGQMVKLTRLLNVLPGDRSVSQVFSIRNGKAKKTGTSEKQLSSGKPVGAPKGDWLPDVTIEADPKMFPFSALLSRPDLRTSPMSCVKVPAAR